MEIIIVIGIAVIGYILYNQFGKKSPEVQQEVAKVEEVVKEVVAEVKTEVVAEAATVKEVAKKTTARAKKALDVNQDGKVDAKDAVAAVKKVAAKTAKPKAVKK
jgi:hypothetical protein